MAEREYAQAVWDTISEDIRHTTGALARRFLLSALVPLVIFLVLAAVAGYVRVWVAATYQTESLNITTAVSTSLVVIVLTWVALRLFERHYHGWAGLRRMMAVLGALTRLETALKEPESLEAQDDLTQRAELAWHTYERYTSVINREMPRLNAS